MSRVVVDTNGSIARAVAHALRHHELVGTPETLAEFYRVIFDPKLERFAPYRIREEVAAILARLSRATVLSSRSLFCRDPKDDKFLEAAVAADAEVIVSGDEDLLVLHPFRGIEIVTASDFLRRFTESPE